MLFTSPPGDLSAPAADGGNLDVTIVTLRNLKKGYPALALAATLPLVDGKTRAFVVGHPRGAGLQISLHDSVLLDVCDDKRLIHYRTPTDPGSSGSPVFNSEFNVIALHHAGSHDAPRLHGAGSYEANEGIALGAIRKKL
jgi:V8-like Glu-specific endopeptidase